ncbi:MAG: substrate-binding domain-containing protein [Spirochaetaceae bacterium]|jgi:DNA-binding LacI/PurR family transcriptional regulator/DNA-binding CsgD family transcriptional regulator|nr:substrate-binding domain-containing protein [Spirochaetaceae bacterium]
MSKNTPTETTIAVLINQIEGRYQSLLLRGFKEYAENHSCRFIFFVGKSLNSPYEYENYYNSIYSLAKGSEIDGIIVASGAIGNYLDLEENKDFLKSYLNTPMVTIGSQFPGIPGIITDNYSGMESLVRHLARFHYYQRIAYISGPQNNPESKARLESYRKGIQQLDLPLDEKLIFQGDFSYQSGYQCADQFIKHGQIVFDALICANDEMALGIMTALRDKGFHAPKDFAITGFDDIPKSHYTSPPLTTVHQPINQQSYNACEILLDMIEGKSFNQRTLSPCKLILRESCGCGRGNRISPQPITAGQEPHSLSSLDIRNIGDSILEKANPPKQHTREIGNILSTLLENVILDIKTLRKQPLFLIALNDWLSLTFHWNSYTELWHNILQQCHNELLSLLDHHRDRAYVNALFQEGYAGVALRTAQKEARKSDKLEWLFFVFRKIAVELNGSLPLTKRFHNLKKNLQELDIDDLYIIGHEGGPQDSSELKQMTLLYWSKQQEDRQHKSFPSRDILPQGFLPLHRVSVILPLVLREIHMGYMVVSGRDIDPLVYDNLREEISLAMYTTSLYERNQRKEEQLKQTLDNLKKSEERYRDMALVVPMMVVETGRELGIRFVNQAAEKGLGNWENIKNLRRIIPKEDHKRLEKILMKLEYRREALVYPDIRLINKETRRLIPVAQLSGIYHKESQELTGIRWNAFDPIPFIKKAVLPDENFFSQYRISPREEEVIKQLLQGLSIQQTADKLFISQSTVKGHLTQIYSKFGVSGKAELLRVIQDYQVSVHGYNQYLFTVMNSLLSIPKNSTKGPGQN